MSITVGPLGTNDLTYYHNPDRNGYLAAYNNALALQRSHDRAVANGSVNAGAHGHVDMDVGSYYNRPKDMSMTKQQRQKIHKPSSLPAALQAVARTNANPRYIK